VVLVGGPLLAGSFCVSACWIRLVVHALGPVGWRCWVCLLALPVFATCLTGVGVHAHLARAHVLKQVSSLSRPGLLAGGSWLLLCQPVAPVCLAISAPCAWALGWRVPVCGLGGYGVLEGKPVPLAPARVDRSSCVTACRPEALRKVSMVDWRFATGMSPIFPQEGLAKQPNCFEVMQWSKRQHPFAMALVKVCCARA
jgi:hypothetical protein